MNQPAETQPQGQLSRSPPPPSARSGSGTARWSGAGARRPCGSSPGARTRSGCVPGSAGRSSRGCRAPCSTSRRPPRARSRSGTGEGQLTVGALTVEVDAEGLIRFLRTADGRRTPGRGPRPLLVARLASVHRRRQRPPPSGAALRRLRRREAVRPRPAPARPAGPEGPGPRPGPAQRRGRHPGSHLQPRLHPAVEQPGDRPRGTGRQRHPLGGRLGPPDRLLDHRGRPRPTASAATAR